MNSTVTIHHLPNELLPFIFRYLGLVDLTRCRLVCRKWKFFVDEQKVQELAIIKNEALLNDDWYSTNKKVNEANVISLDLFETGCFLRFKRQLMRFEMLMNLKRLKVCLRTIVHAEFFSSLNHFAKLEILQLESVQLREHQTINHQNLKVIYVYYIFNDLIEMELEIDCPNCEILHFTDCFHYLTIKNPESIRHLSGVYQYYNNRVVDLSPFVNLEYLEFGNLSELNANFLAKLPKLKVFKCGYDDEDLIDRELYFISKDVLIELFKQKQVLKRDLKLIHNNKEFMNIDQVYDHFYDSSDSSFSDYY